METYQQIKARHQKDLDTFPLGAAFSNSQLEEMMKKFGLPNDKTGYAQLVSLGAGVFIMRKDVPAWNEMSERHEREMKEFRACREQLTEALRYEFANHEYMYSQDDDAVCRSVGLSSYEVKNDPVLLETYKKAKALFWEDCRKNDWI